MTVCIGCKRESEIKCPNGLCKYCCIEGHYENEIELNQSVGEKGE